MAKTSRIPGFYQVTVSERRTMVSEVTGLTVDEMEQALDGGGLDADVADKFVENVLGTYSLPFGVALNVRVNGRDYVVPMVVEEPSVVAAASNAAKMVRMSGGFSSEVDLPVTIGQIQLTHVPDRDHARRAILAQEALLLRIANEAIPGLVGRGGGAVGVEVRDLNDPSMLVVHILINCLDAMGANLVNSVAEHLAPRLAEIARARIGLRILSNLADRRCVRVRGRVRASDLATEEMSGEAVLEGMLNASQFAELDPYRAATHNKGIMNGVDAVVIATGNDWRAVEAGAHAYAARNGRYEPLATWHEIEVDGERAIEGRMCMPLALGTVGGTLRVHRAARLALRMLGVERSGELAMVAASLGLASNLAAIRALASDGIQRGHMALHARSVALAAGAEGALVERVAAIIVEARDITLEAAKRALDLLNPQAEGAVPVPEED